jgi:hypothetical protein
MQVWRWEGLDAPARCGGIFGSLHECAEDARRHGFEIDLVRVPLAEHVGDSDAY